MDWSLLGSAVALCLVFEGLLPFANPGVARRVYAYMMTQTDRSLRGTGLALVIIGLVMLQVFGRG